MDLKDSNTTWVETIFDVSEPYLYVLVLPALVLSALGLPRQALLFALGAATFFIIYGAT
jgi:hypothetical protein